ncbi:CGNR zinc finger domain-containing protein [Kitasatospora sp. NPDC052896]|uniref:CGNR zinc finger domain-containing protein n=1 Tax=Kitasatospora sp. NPDC052896 TaxID=3364061 RepID=UPI0037C84E16
MTEDLGRANPRGLYFIVELANAVQEGTPGAAELRSLLDRHGAPAFTLTEPEAAGLRAAAAELVAVLSQDDPDVAAELLNGLLDRYPAQPRLVRLPGRTWSLHARTPAGADRTHWLLSTSALALALWLSEREGCAWGRCAAPGCARFFVDAGRRTPQRYCSPRCATRVRVAAHRSQKRS